MLNSIFILWPGHPMLSLSFWAAIIVLCLYVARSYAHQAIEATGGALYKLMRAAARALRLSEGRLAERNNEVLLAAGAEQVERRIEREFHRVGMVVEHDLQPYPALHRRMADVVKKIEEDYSHSTEVPPPPPGWTEAVGAVAAIPSNGDPVVGKMLLEINKTLESHHKEALRDYRRASSTRHGLLKQMLPLWRRLGDNMSELGRSVHGLVERAVAIDRHMDDYAEIRHATDKAKRTLTSSASTQFFVSGLVLLIAIGGAFINFNLIALPMSEMVGGTSYIGAMRTADVAALVIIFVEMAMGLFLMEALKITRLFPLIGALDDRVRVRMLWVTLVILLSLAGIESSLAFMRDRIALDLQALRQSLAGDEAMAMAPSMIPTIGQMVMGFILPFALAFVAIPFESFVHSTRVVAGRLAEALLRTFALVLRIGAIGSKAAASVMLRVYDLVIFLPLSIERFALERAKKAGEAGHAKVEPVVHKEAVS